MNAVRDLDRRAVREAPGRGERVGDEVQPGAGAAAGEVTVTESVNPSVAVVSL